MSLLNKKYIKIGPAIINSVKEWLLVIYIKQFIKRWDEQNKDYHSNKKLFLRQYFKLLTNKYIEEFYNKEADKKRVSECFVKIIR